MKVDYDAACTRLVEAMRVIHDVEHIQVTVVFDGQGTVNDLSNPGEDDGFTVIYTAKDKTADAVIEHMALRAAKTGPVIVGSRDNLLTQSVAASGGDVCSPGALREWHASCASRQVSSLRKRRQQNQIDWQADNPWRKLDS